MYRTADWLHCTAVLVSECWGYSSWSELIRGWRLGEPYECVYLSNKTARRLCWHCGPQVILTAVSGIPSQTHHQCSNVWCSSSHSASPQFNTVIYAWHDFKQRTAARRHFSWVELPHSRPWLVSEWWCPTKMDKWFDQTRWWQRPIVGAKCYWLVPCRSYYWVHVRAAAAAEGWPPFDGFRKECMFVHSAQVGVLHLGHTYRRLVIRRSAAGSNSRKSATSKFNYMEGSGVSPVIGYVEYAWNSRAIVLSFLGGLD